MSQSYRKHYGPVAKRLQNGFILMLQNLGLRKCSPPISCPASRCSEAKGCPRTDSLWPHRDKYSTPCTIYFHPGPAAVRKNWVDKGGCPMVRLADKSKGVVGAQARPGQHTGEDASPGRASNDETYLSVRTGGSFSFAHVRTILEGTL